MKLRIYAMLALALLMLTPARPAAAHAYLDRSLPRDGATLSSPPPEVELWFTEAIVDKLSSVRLLDSAGNPVAGTETTSLAPSALLLRVPPLPAGQYQVTWKVVSVDTHSTEGSIRFTVKGAAAEPAQPAPQPAQPALFPWALLGGAALVALVGGLVLQRRRRKDG